MINRNIWSICIVIISYIYIELNIFINIYCAKSKLFLALPGVPLGGRLSSLIFSLLVNGTDKNMLINNKLLCFAGYMKLFRRINSINDYVMLQSDK